MIYDPALVSKVPYTGERWRELCEQAAQEQDSARLILLVNEINRLLQEKQERLNRTRPKRKEQLRC